MQTRQNRAFSLFEMLFSLVIMAAITIAGILYAQAQAEKQAAELLGVHLYEYGLAVADYIRQNPERISAGKDYEKINYQWLQQIDNPENCKNLGGRQVCEKFLGQDFQFSVPHLHFRTPTNAPDLVMKTHFRYDDFSKSLTLIEIEVAPIVIMNSQKGGYTPAPTLAARAANYANTHISSDGLPQIKYSINPKNPYTPITGHTMKDVGANPGYLLTSGQNAMYGSIQFDADAPKKDKRIDNVVQINMGDTQPSSTAPEQPEINGVYQINFSGKTGNSALGALQTSGDCTVHQDGNYIERSTEGQIASQGSALPTQDGYFIWLTPAKGSICMLVETFQMAKIAQSNPTITSGCSVNSLASRSGGSDDLSYRLEIKKSPHAEDKMHCTARCLIWDPNIDLSQSDSYCAS